MKIKENYILKEVAGVMVAVPVGSATSDFNGMLKLNGTAVFLWHELEKGATVESLADALVNEYDVEHDKAVVDINNFIGKLNEAKCLED